MFFPGGHNLQDALPVEFSYAPGAHTVHEDGVSVDLYLPMVHGVHSPSFLVDPSNVIESFAEALEKLSPIEHVEMFMFWHSVGLEGMWNWPARHMKAVTWAQVLVELVQNMPVEGVQSVVPHLQSIPAVLAVAPLMNPHGTRQYVSSLPVSTREAVLPVGHVPHEAASEKETSGLDMYLPLGQQPDRP